MCPGVATAGGAMAESGSETRQRDERHTVRFTPLEDALICAKANAAGVPVATFLRNTALAFPMPRAARRPTSNHEEVALLLGRIGQLAAAFRSAATLADAISRSFAFCVSPPWGASHDPAIPGHGYIARH
ncbi:MULTISPECIES: plasmid mobilization protein [Bradyrhizobium]|uniref:plasmid mobilization protein n=2 Tax=Bradyrhizobium TaxID=374 RepID=UPI00352C5D59